MNPQQACLDAIQRVSRNYNDDQSRLAKMDIFFYALRKDGAYGSASLWDDKDEKGARRPGRFVVNDRGESRYENAAFLYQRHK
jgi:hypothetical protein